MDNRSAQRPPENFQLATFLTRWALSDKEIARVLGKSRNSVNIYLRYARSKAGARNRTQLAVMACRRWGFPYEAPPRNRSETEMLMASNQATMEE